MPSPSAHFAAIAGWNAHGDRSARATRTPAGSPREARLGEHEVATHLVDDVELVDRDRALLHARAAARARPELLFGDVGVEQSMLHALAGRSAAGVVAFAAASTRAQNSMPVAVSAGATSP
jgi:hypothetical protein